MPTSNPIKDPVRIILILAFIFILWIFLSDQLLLSFLQDADEISRWQTVKDISFIIFISLILFLLNFKDKSRSTNILTNGDIENQIGLVMKATKTGTWSWNMKTNKTTWSNENYLLLGYEPGSVDSNYENWEKCVHVDDLENTKEHVNNAVNTISNLDFQFRVVHPDGTVHWLQDVGRMILDRNDEPIGMYGILIDVTEHKLNEAKEEEINSQLRQAQKMEAVGRLAGGVAHDFNNMLTVITGYTEMALYKTDPSDPSRKYLQEVMNAAKRSKSITGQMLAFARKQTIRPIALELNNTIDSMLKILQHLIGENINMEWLPKTGLWLVKMDPSQIDQILANTCVNARDAISDVGKITIQTENIILDEAFCSNHTESMPGEFVCLTVTDDGCGMGKEDIDRIFEPFFTSKDKDQGTGLGLSTVYGIVKQNNGFINVSSEINKGTTFKIYLSRYVGEVEIPKTQDTTETPPSRGETLLLVEDETSILNLTENILNELGYTVLSTEKPHEAINLAQTHTGPIHLLITDTIMPKMNGRDLSERIHAMHPDLKTLFMSGYTANIIANHGVLDADVNFIPKPFSRQELALKVREALESKEIEG